jgi:rubrerythrin
MGKLLNMSEVLEFAVAIEQQGYKFYVETIKKMKEAKILALFQYLADEEFKHEHIFKELKKKVGDFTPPESYEGEYETYMNDFIKSNFLKKIDNMQATIDSVKTIDDAVHVALDLERDSIVFYTALKKYIGEDNQNVIETIIQEELSHIMKINHYIKNYQPLA